MRSSPRLLCLVLLLGLTLACGPLSLLNATVTPTPASAIPVQPATIQPVQTSVKPQASGPTIAQLVEFAVSQRSVKLHMSTTRPDGSLYRLEAEIDTIGSQHVVKTYPASSTAIFENGIPNPPATAEFYLVDNVVYSPDENGVLKPSDSEGMDTFLQAALLSTDGPAFWLKVLSAGSLTSSGDEAYGGFNARRYAVQASLEGLPITGTIWVEPSLQALVGADLSIPGKLAGPYTQGTLQIQYQLEKTDVSLIQPDLSQPTATDTPSTQIGPGGLPAFSNARNVVSQPGMFFYDSDADVSTIKQFYLDYFKANGWVISGSALETGGVYIAKWTKGNLAINLAITANDPSGSLIMITCESCQ